MLKEQLFTPAIWFELTIQGKSVGYFTEVTGLSAEVETMTYNEGGNNEFVHRLPTRVKYPNLVLKRGVTGSAILQQWFQKSHTQAERTGITVSMLNEQGERIRTWNFVNAFPIKWTGPTFNATQSALATEAIEIAHDGCKAV
ncbi:MAG: phage tail protein [Solirubrobacteraceae bacterium]